MTETVETPIVVHDSSVPKQIMTAAQYAVSTISAYAIGKGWIGKDEVGLVAALVPVVVPIVYGIYKTWHSNEQKKIMAQKLPDSTAVIVK